MGFGGSKSAPDTPDLGQTIGTQVGGNLGLTRYNNRAMQYGTSSPFGTTDWTKMVGSGGDVKKATYIDPYTGKKIKTPLYQQNINLSPEEQQKYDLSNKAQIGALEQANKLMGSMGNFGLNPYDFTKSIGDYGGSVYDATADKLTLGNEATEKRLYELGSKRLDPQHEKQQALLDAKLTAQGLRPGTAAWNAAKTQQSQSENDAYNQLLLTGRGQAANEQQAEWQSRLAGQGQQFGQAADVWGRSLAQRGQYAGEQFGTQDRNISYLTQLLQAGQPNMPQFTSTQPGASPYMDYAGAINTNWDQQFKSWAQEMQNKNSIGGGIGSAVAGIIGSDERIKDNIKQVGKTQDGLPIYEFSIGDGEMQTGVMAQDVEKVNPAAVVENAAGIKGVDYPAAVGDGTGTYTVEEGDSIWKIGERLGVDPQVIIQANPDIQNPDFIVPGQQLVVPGMAAPGPEAIPLEALTGAGVPAVAQALLPGSNPEQLTSDTGAALAGGVAPGLMQPTYPGGAGGARPDPTQIDPAILRQMLMSGGMGGY